MEAENFLAGGHAIRQSIEARPSGWQTLGTIACSWQPSRLKGIQVSKEFGIPFLAATQVFDMRPVPRKWLSLDRTSNSEGRFLDPGTIVLTCSGSVGHATLAHAPHAGIMVSHDLIRVAPKRFEIRGWLYAFLKSRSAQEMMTASQYGHIIKHLETEHLDTLPIPTIGEERQAYFADRVDEILRLRDRAHTLTLAAESLFAEALGEPRKGDDGTAGFAARASNTLFAGRRRFEAYANRPEVHSLKRHLARKGAAVTPLVESGYSVWLPSRFKRVPAAEGVEFLDSADLFEINPVTTKRIADGDFGDPYRGRVKAGWLLLARSGQIYGINGSVVMATKAHEGKVISDHVIRIAPQARPAILAGYLFVALSHPVLGRPLLKAMAYGSSIPEIDPADVQALGVVRLAAAKEAAIARLAEEASALRGEADLIENDIAARADDIIEQLRRGGARANTRFGYGEQGVSQSRVAEGSSRNTNGK